MPYFQKKSIFPDNDWKVNELTEKLKDRRLDLGDVSPSDGERFAKAINQPVQGIQVSQISLIFSYLHELRNYFRFDYPY